MRARFVLTVVILLIAISAIGAVWWNGREDKFDPDAPHTVEVPTTFDGIRMSGRAYTELYFKMTEAEKDSLYYIMGPECVYREELKNEACDLIVLSQAYVDEHGYNPMPSGFLEKQPWYTHNKLEGHEHHHGQ